MPNTNGNNTNNNNTDNSNNTNNNQRTYDDNLEKNTYHGCRHACGCCLVMHLIREPSPVLVSSCPADTVPNPFQGFLSGVVFRGRVFLEIFRTVLLRWGAVLIRVISKCVMGVRTSVYKEILSHGRLIMDLLVPH